VITFVLFVTFLDNTIVAVALSDVQTELHAGIQALQWVVSGYALTFAGLMLSFGTIGDRMGRRKVMVVGLAIFTVGSAIGTAATSPGMLIGARVVMGVGAAASEPGTLSMIRQLWDDPGERAQALAVWSAISGLALAAGPVLGGILVGSWNWRGVFAFNVAAGVVGLAGVLWVLPESADPTRKKLDAAGTIWAAAAITSATVATILGETQGFLTWPILAVFGFSALSVIVFVVVESRAEQPILDLRFFRRRSFSAGMVVAFSGFFATFAVFFFVPLFVELLGNTSSLQLSLDFLPMAVALIGASAASGRWLARSGPGLPMLFGSVVAAGGIFATDALIKPDSGVELFGWSLSLVGLGLGVLMVAATVSVLAAVPPERSGMAASAVNTSRELGAVTGVTVLGAIINAQLTTNLLHRLSGIPGLDDSLRNQVVVAITTGQANTSNLPKTGPIARIIAEVLGAAQGSFASGLDTVLIMAGVLVLASGAVAAVLTRGVPGRIQVEASPDRPVQPVHR
jgi:EmrB/QacA subfamily drug resistance transporter